MRLGGSVAGTEVKKEWAWWGGGGGGEGAGGGGAGGTGWAAPSQMPPPQSSDKRQQEAEDYWVTHTCSFTHTTASQMAVVYNTPPARVLGTETYGAQLQSDQCLVCS